MYRPITLWPAATLALAILSIAGCTVGPKYHQPTPPVPAQFKEGGTPDAGTPDIAYTTSLMPRALRVAKRESKSVQL